MIKENTSKETVNPTLHKTNVMCRFFSQTI